MRPMTVHRHRSAPASPGDRGRDLGLALAPQIHFGLGVYRRLWALSGREDEGELHRLGGAALERTARFAPELAEEIEGIAAGAGIAAELAGAINARTELLAPAAAECSVAVSVEAPGGPVGMQTWDWHDELDGTWLVWEIEHPGGPTVRTLTEAGIVGKIGLSSAGVGVLLNILGQDADRPDRGIPVHVAARAVLDRAAGAEEAAELLLGLETGASSAATLVGRDGACTVELSPQGAVRIDPREGLLVHTNHFLAGLGRHGDRGLRESDATVDRLMAMRQAVARQPRPIGAAELGRAYDEAGCGDGRVCCHPGADAAFGDRWRTLATVVVEPARDRLAVARGGPCAGAREALAAAPGLTY
jgi:isopenicillin-N N-acyltransferase like protein